LRARELSRPGFSAALDAPRSATSAMSVTTRGCMSRPPITGSRSLGRDDVRPHHLVVLVLDDVAVPDVQSRYVERGPDGRDVSGVGEDGMLEARFPRLDDRVHRLEAGDGPPTHDLEPYHMHVDRMPVLGEVVDLPILDIAL